jgi:plastocyanin
MRLSWLRALTLVAAAAAAGCGSDAPPPQTPRSDAKRVDQTKTGTIAGRVVIEGPVPENPVARVDDSFCARENKGGFSLENFVVVNGGLDNVFVRIKDGLGDYYFETPSGAAKIDQHSCRYTPHVIGIQTGQALEISNSDQTMHNVSAVAKVNRGFNFGQPMQGLKNTTSFKEPEVMVHLKCDVHGWMSAYIGVVAHPYFGVTSGGGQFELKNVPPGTYTIEAWHEKLGTQTQNVTLGDKESKELSFTFKTQATVP